MAKADRAGHLCGSVGKGHGLLHHQMQPGRDTHHDFGVQPRRGRERHRQTAILHREKHVARAQRPTKPTNGGRKNFALLGPAETVGQMCGIVELDHQAPGRAAFRPDFGQGPVETVDHLVRNRNRRGAQQVRPIGHHPKRQQGRKRDQSGFAPRPIGRETKDR